VGEEAEAAEVRQCANDLQKMLQKFVGAAEVGIQP
jgi:hypothetical protein